jgi:aminoglycoside 2''-phosphotransferase
MFDEAPDLHSIGAALVTLFPDLDPLLPIHMLGLGFSSLVLETARGIVFRIARNQDAASRHAKESRLLPRLKSVVPLPIPDPQWSAGPSDVFPFGLIGYHKLSGTPLHPAQLTSTSRIPIARALASFLRALHAFPTREAHALRLDGPAQLRAQLVILRAEILPALRVALTRQEYQTLVQWWDAFLCDPALQQFPPVLQHGDLWYENILTDATMSVMTGVLDFENSAIGDPAQDFATLNYFGQPFVREVIELYQATGGDLGTNVHYRVQKYWELRDFDGIQFAVRFNDTEEFADSLVKLREGPILKA